MRAKKLFDILVVTAGVSLLIGSWYIQIQNKKLSDTNRKLLEAREFPIVLGSLQLDLEADTELVEQYLPDKDVNDQRVVRRKLVLLSSDTCGICENNLPNWERLVSEGDWAPGCEVMILTYGEPEICAPVLRRLRQNRRTFRVLRITNSLLFGLRTGLIATPATLLLDAKNRIELVHAGELLQAELVVFKDGLNGKTLHRQAKPFLYGTRE